MLTVKQKNYYGKKDVVIGYFTDIKQVFDYFKNIHGMYELEKHFSHDPSEYYRRTFVYSREYKQYTSRYVVSAPEYCYVISNDKDIRYSRETVLGEFRKIRKGRKFGYYRYFYGYKRHNRGSYHRRPDTFQERTMSVNVIEEEGEPKWRPSRNMHNLPTTYDDLQHYDQRINNWKRYRKTQWK